MTRFRACYQHIFILATLIIAVGCQPPSSQDDGTGQSGQKHIAVIPKGTTHVFWQSVRVGAEQAADD
ncbi:MAG: hypothetical protein AAF745_12620, partial [Planctomycetota bacterium]